MDSLLGFDTIHFNFIPFREDPEHEKYVKSLNDSQAWKFCRGMFYNGYKSIKNHKKPYGQIYYIVQDKKTGEFIGAIFSTGFLQDRGRGLSYVIDKNHRKQKYGSIVVAETILHYWQEGTRYIDIHVRNDNEGSIALGKKLGFTIAEKEEGKKSVSKYILEKTQEHQDLLERLVQQYDQRISNNTQQSQSNEINKLRQSISPKDLREASKTRFSDFCKQKFLELISTIRNIRNKSIDRSK